MKGKRFPCRQSILFISLLSLFLIPTYTFGATIKVPGDQPTIQAGIDAASDGDTVLVADGTYKGEGNKNLDFKGKAITVQSESGKENCIIDCENEGRGFNFHSKETAESILSSFTIKKGKIDGYGGGIYCSSSSPTIKDCVITDNSCQGNNCAPPCKSAAGGDGGGIYCESASPIIENCSISNNSARGTASTGDIPGLGGGIFCTENSSPSISGCSIIGNYGGRGGGISCDLSSPRIINCFIYNNNPKN